MRKRALFFGLLLFLSMGLGIPGSTAEAAIYFVRPDGGTETQCTGLADVPYPGSGTNQPCAWSHPFWAVTGLYSAPSWKIQGGDTLILSQGTYMIGLDAPNTETCDPFGAFGCVLPPLPSGPDSAHPTRILGKGWDQDCPSPPILWGTERVWQILDLTGTSNAQISCLEITDHSNCVEFHSNPQVACERSSPPFGPWAAVGISASDSANVLLSHLNIHGLAHGGILAGRLADWTVSDVRVAGNGWVGWDGDIYGTDSNRGTLHFQNWVVEWNGCGETYPGQQPDHCWDQNAGGYGDGVGTGSTGGHWIIEDSVFRYNTSDGLDLLYVGRVPGEDSQIEVRRTRAYGNAGNQIKTSGPTRIENTLAVSNCSLFENQPFGQEMSLHCRAGGAALALSVGRGHEASLVNSTIAGQGDCLATFECASGQSACDGSEKLVVLNNIFKGYPDFFDPSDQACYFWFDRDNFYQLSMDYNIIHDAKISSGVPVGAHDILEDPLLADDSLYNFNGHLQSAASPAVGSGLPAASLDGMIPDHDLENNPRPLGWGVDRGAFELKDEDTPAPPAVNSIKASKSLGAAPLAITFSAVCSGQINQWFWSFGDGQTSTEVNPTYLYRKPGSYTVSLEVTGPAGSALKVERDFISVLSPLAVTSPNGGEIWRTGQAVTIRWTYTGTPGNYLKIELLRDGKPAATVSSRVRMGSNGSGSYQWRIPQTLAAGTAYRIRITSTENSDYTDVSNASFTIKRR